MTKQSLNYTENITINDKSLVININDYNKWIGGDRYIDLNDIQKYHKKLERCNRDCLKFFTKNIDNTFEIIDGHDVLKIILSNVFYCYIFVLSDFNFKLVTGFDTEYI